MDGPPLCGCGCCVTPLPLARGLPGVGGGSARSNAGGSIAPNRTANTLAIYFVSHRFNLPIGGKLSNIECSCDTCDR